MYHEEGFFYNDTNSDWRGITVFSAAQLGECLLDFPECLDPAEYAAIRERFLACAEYLRIHITQIGGNINYPLTCAWTMAVAHKITGEEKYGQRARELARSVRQYMTEDGLIFGEGKNRQEISPKGCRPVDIGYNVEESLPALLQYALLEQDEEIRALTVKAMRVHLEFMLPDGAWDNSFGTRNYKWSYWGSRTSDGCAAGYGLADDPVLQEAFRRNTQLLERCTQDGLLYGGPMFAAAGEPPCVHHTFCHAKGLAAFLKKSDGKGRPDVQVKLPSDQRDGIRSFSSIQTLLLGKGQWRATVTAYDVEYHRQGHPSGGAVSLLWHRRLGPVLCGSMGNYELVEPNNMQLLRKSLPVCLTPRIECMEAAQIYRNIYDRCAVMEWRAEADALFVTVQGKMASDDGNAGAAFSLGYELREEGFRIAACCEAHAELILPVISMEGEPVTISADGRELWFARANGSAVFLKGSVPFCLPLDGEGQAVRGFSPVGGMQAVTVKLELERGKGVSCEIQAVWAVSRNQEPPGSADRWKK